jgi:hypothetical protein
MQRQFCVVFRRTVSKNPFSRKVDPKKSSYASPRSISLPNDEPSLRSRAEERKQFDFTTVPLTVRNQTSSGRFYESSFIDLATQYPRHEHLIKQLLHGAQLDLGSRLVSYPTHQDCYYAIEEFIDFLNKSIQSEHKVISIVSDIDFQTTRNFAAYYLEKYPGRTVNRKRFGRLRSAVVKLKKKYESDSGIGEAIAWAQSPDGGDTPSESYSDEVFNQIIVSCFADIKFIMKMMKQYPDQLHTMQKFIAASEPFSLDKRTVKRTWDDQNKIIFALVANARPSWPLFDSFDDAQRWWTIEWRDELDEGSRELRLLHNRLTSSRVQYSMMNHTNNEVIVKDLEAGQLAYICQFFFTIKTLFPFILFLQINTGWNLEVVLSLSDDLDSHLGEDLVDPEQYVLIYGTKLRSKSVLYHRSNKNHPYSVYNVLRFVADQVGKYKSSPHFNKDYLWQGVTVKNLWNKHRRILARVDLATYSAASRAFLKRHEIKLDRQAKYVSIESRRLRTTWETKRREQGLDIGSVSNMMGHRSVDLTVASYDSDAGSSNLRNKKLRQLQQNWDNDFRDYGVRLSLSTTLAQLRSAIAVPAKKKIISRAAAELGIEREEEVITLLSPEGQTYIAACLDSQKPTWPSSDQFLSSGDKCSYFNRCCLCKQAVIFKESLPYISRRIFDLENLKLRITAIEWSNNYAEESTAWEKILERWKPEKDVQDAMLISNSPEYALPLTMRGVL